MNVVRLYAHLQDGQYHYLVMEYIPKRNLFLQIPKRKGLNEDRAFWFFI